MSRPDKFPDCMALSSKREACLGYRETFTKLDLEEKENERLRTITDDMIRAACNAYGASQGACEFDWMRDALTAALASGQSAKPEELK